MVKTEVTGLIKEQGRITGIRAPAAGGILEVRADLVVGADGRNSTIRDCAGLAVEDLDAPMDVLWMRLSRRAGDPELLAYSDRGRPLAPLDRGSYRAVRLFGP